MTIPFPSFTRHDPKLAGEGNLDPLGLGQIADQLAVELVPGIRERMSRPRFLTAMTVGSIVLEDLEHDPAKSGVAPFFVWEWLVLESFVRCEARHPDLKSVPGIQMTRSAMREHGYLDAASYLKTPRIFGFHGVYKRLASRLGLVDAELRPMETSESLLNAWAKGQGYPNFEATAELRAEWRRMIFRGLNREAPSTKSLLTAATAEVVAKAFSPGRIPAAEKRVLRALLNGDGPQDLGAFSSLSELLASPNADELSERELHDSLAQRAPRWAKQVRAIQAYESFARTLQDAFDTIRHYSGARYEQGLALEELGASLEFQSQTRTLAVDYRRAEEALAKLTGSLGSVSTTFHERFESFATVSAAQLPELLLSHHEKIQAAKPPEGKRSWFDRLGNGRVFLRHPYRLDDDWEPQPGEYVHPYRSNAIASFLRDLQ